MDTSVGNDEKVACRAVRANNVNGWSFPIQAEETRLHYTAEVVGHSKLNVCIEPMCNGLLFEMENFPRRIASQLTAFLNVHS